MKNSIFLLIFICCIQLTVVGQNIGISATGAAPNASAMLDVTSTNSGLLIPRMTTEQRTAIVSPATGLQVFDNDTKSFWFWNGIAWTLMAGSGGSNHWTLNGSNIYNSNVIGNVGIGTLNPANRLQIGTLPTGYSGYDIGVGNFGQGMVFQQNGNFSNWQSSTNITLLPVNGTGNVGINTTNPGAPLSFPNKLGNKISFWRAGVNNDFGIGINTGVMQLYTAGQDRIAFGYGNANAFNETLAIWSGSGLLSYPNVLGNKISFWRAGPNNDFGIGINSGVMQLYTAGQDKIAFGYGNANAFIEKITFLTGSGQVGLGTTKIGNYQLAVNGNIHSTEIVVETGWADYVFDEKYKLPSLESVEKFILQNKHLPNIPSASEIEKNGLHVGDTQKRMMEKIEELTLYVIELKKEITELKKKTL